MNIDWSQMVTVESAAAEFEAAAWATLKCTRLQGRLVLGPETCATLDAMAADPATPWAMRETIANAAAWHCNSQSMDELAYLLGYSDADRLALFRKAVEVRV